MSKRLIEIPGLPGYRVDECGNIFSTKRTKKPKKMFLWPNLKGYLAFGPYLNNKRIRYYVHTSVLEAFHGLRPTDRPVSRHLDGNKANNHKDNLCWGTPKENYKDSVRHGTCARGERQGAAKLTTVQVREIKKRKRPAKELAEKYGVTISCICHILSGKNWSHV